MAGRTLIVALIGAGCMVAAGAGSYLATRAGTPILEPEAAAVAALEPDPEAQAALTDAEPKAAGEASAESRQPAAPTAVRAESSQAEQGPPPVAVPEPVEPREPPRAAARVAVAPPEPEPEPVPPVAAAVEHVTGPPLARAIPGLRPPPPPEPEFVEFTIAEDSVIGIRLEDEVSSETAKVEDRVMARVSRDVIVAGRTVIPAGTWLEGHVTLVERGGRFQDKAKLGLRFTTLHLSEQERLPVLTEAITREGDSPTDEAASKIGASAVIGTILGAVIGGKKGAAIGSAAGAAGGTAAVASGDCNAAALAAGTPLTVRLTEPVAVLIKRKHD